MRKYIGGVSMLAVLLCWFSFYVISVNSYISPI